MKKIILLCLTLLSLFSCLCFCSKEVYYDSSQENKEVLKLDSYESNNLTESNIANSEHYDFITYDINRNEYFYQYSDFEYNTDITPRSYDISMRNNDEVDFDGKIIALRDDDDDDPYEMYYSLPYSAVCLVVATYDTNYDGVADNTCIGTGTMVGPDAVLTSEENVYNLVYGYPLSLTISPGAYTNNNGVLVKPYGDSSSTMIMRGNYASTHNVDDNWALIKLSSSLGYNSGWLDVAYTGISNGSYVSACSYSNNNNVYSISDHIGVVSNLQTYSFNHNANPPSISSGAPVIDLYSDKVYGIQCGQRVYINGIQYSQAGKVSNYLANYVQDFGGVLEVRIFADDSSLTGHAWLTIKNNSPYAVNVGKSVLLAYESISLGTWPALNRPYSGLYYNLEHYKYVFNSDLTHHVSYKKNVFIPYWNSKNYNIIDHDAWTVMINCVVFAVEVWNGLFPLNTFEVAVDYGELPVPTYLYAQITSTNSYENNIYVNGGSPVGYFDGDTFCYYSN